MRVSCAMSEIQHTPLPNHGGSGLGRHPEPDTPAHSAPLGKAALQHSPRSMAASIAAPLAPLHLGSMTRYTSLTTRLSERVHNRLSHRLSHPDSSPTLMS